MPSVAQASSVIEIQQAAAAAVEVHGLRKG